MRGDHHTARQWLHRHRSDASKVALSVDISHAFNSVLRSAVLRSVRVHFPSLAPWVDCCYRHDSVLFTGSTMVASQVISSARGVQQGDPPWPGSLRTCHPESFWGHVLPQRPRTRVGLIFAPFTSMTGSVLVLPLRYNTFFLPARGQDPGYSCMFLLPVVCSWRFSG